jgi:hypothetical protein
MVPLLCSLNLRIWSLRISESSPWEKTILARPLLSLLAHPATPRSVAPASPARKSRRLRRRLFPIPFIA